MLLLTENHQLFGRPDHQVGPVPLTLPCEELPERTMDALLGLKLQLLGRYPDQVA